MNEDADLVKVEPGNVAWADALVLHQAALVCRRGVYLYVDSLGCVMSHHYMY